MGMRMIRIDGSFELFTHECCDEDKVLGCWYLILSDYCEASLFLNAKMLSRRRSWDDFRPMWFDFGDYWHRPGQELAS